MTARVGRLDPRVLFAPGSVAIVGASANPAGHPGRTLSNLVRTGFPGRIYPVNPKYDELDGLRCYPDVAAIAAAEGTAPDVVYVLLPAQRAVETVRAAGAAGAQLAVVCSSGFSELGEAGASLQDELRVAARESGIRVIGPNCIGVISPSGRYVGAPTFNITYDQHPGGVSILSHSGGLAVTVFNRAQAAGVGVHSVVSLGNEADVTMATVLDSLLDDDTVHTVALVIEQVREPEAFVAAARAARAAGKRLVALKTGRSATGSAAVSGHTGALAGDTAVFSAVAREAGILEATSLDQLTDTVHLLERLEAPIGHRLGVVSPSGGETVYAADQAAAHGIELPPLTPELAAEIHEWMPLGTPANPLDLTGSIIGDSSLLTKVLDALGGQDQVDLLMVALATWGPFDADAILAQVIGSARAAQTPVIFSAWDAGAMTDRVVELLSGSGMAWFPSPDRALAAVSLAARSVPVVVPPTELARAVPRPDGADAGPLGEVAATALLAAAGVPVAETAVVATPEEAAALAERWRAPVVLKVQAPEVLHKSELGLVEVDLRTPAEVAEAGAQLLARADQHGIRQQGLLVARREQGVEVIVGGVDDPAFGRFVLVGAGGVLAEHLRDTVLVSAPATAETVERALTSLSSYPLIQGVRGQSYDVPALVDLVVEFSRVFAGSTWMREVDLNPVIVRSAIEGGAVAVDAVIVPSPTDPADAGTSTGATP